MKEEGHPCVVYAWMTLFLFLLLLIRVDLSPCHVHLGWKLILFYFPEVIGDL